MYEGRHCDYCGGEFFPTPLHQFKIILRNGRVKYFCKFTCQEHYKAENPKLVRGEKRGKRKSKA